MLNTWLVHLRHFVLILLNSGFPYLGRMLSRLRCYLHQNGLSILLCSLLFYFISLLLLYCVTDGLTSWTSCPWHLVQHMSPDEHNFNWHHSRHLVLFGWTPGKIFFVHMDNIKDEGSINSPSVLDGTDYDYWKAKMVSFLKPIKIKTWKLWLKVGDIMCLLLKMVQQV